MPNGPTSINLVEQVQVLFTAGTAVGLSDRDLLERFLDHGSESGEAAFTALVERHGPMVLRVCNQALRDPHAAEDAFQATFLVLARRAGSIRRRDSLESWLFGVATRAAARIRMMEARRQRFERQGASVRAHGDTEVHDPAERWPELYAEIVRLPPKNRIAILLCYFEGLTHEQAAARLGWPVGTVKTRLSRAREQLRCRLGPRGWSSALLIPAEPLRPVVAASVHRRLLDTTTRAAARFLSGAGAGESLSSTVVAISRGVLNVMMINQLKLAAITLFGVAMLGLGTFVLARQTSGDRQADGQTVPPPVPPKESPRTTGLSLNGSTSFVPETVSRIHAPFGCRIEKVLVDLGANVKTGDPLLELSSIELAEAKSSYEAAVSQWTRDKKVLNYKTPLATASNISRTELINVENDEAQSRLKMKLAKDKLLVHGLSEAEIENARNEDGVQKARMILRSRADGVVVQRSVVPGNYHDSKDTLLVIAGIDMLWVRANIDPGEADKFEVGQHITVYFPFGNQTVDAKVESISWEAEPETGKVTVRTSIPNLDHRWKAGMLVRLALELGPPPQSTRATNISARRKPNLSLEERLNDVERKLERLLDEKDGRSTNAVTLGRLSELERKLDRVLNLRTGK